VIFIGIRNELGKVMAGRETVDVSKIGKVRQDEKQRKLTTENKKGREKKGERK